MNKKVFGVLLGAMVLGLVLWVIFPSQRTPAAPKTPSITNIQFGTYSTSTKSITMEKNEFSQTEEIGVRGLVNDLPAGSLMLIIVSKDNQNYYANQLPNKTAITQEPFHFTYGQKRPAGTYNVLLELFGPNNQQIGEKIEQTFTVK